MIQNIFIMYMLLCAGPPMPFMLGPGKSKAAGNKNKRKFNILGRYAPGTRNGVKPKNRNPCLYIYRNGDECKGTYCTSKEKMCIKHRHEQAKQKRMKIKRKCMKCGEMKKENKFWRKNPLCNYCFHGKRSVRKGVDNSLRQKTWLKLVLI